MSLSFHSTVKQCISTFLTTVYLHAVTVYTDMVCTMAEMKIEMCDL